MQASMAVAAFDAAAVLMLLLLLLRSPYLMLSYVCIVGWNHVNSSV